MFDDDDGQKLKNFLLCNVWATDNELGKAAPAIFIGIVIFFIIIFIMYKCS